MKTVKTRGFLAIFLVSGLAGLLLGMGTAGAGMGSVRLPKAAEPYLYGNIDLNRLAGKAGMEPVKFSHWSHRLRYQCRVCHSELGFPMRRGATDIAKTDFENGLYCGACHDGKTAFTGRLEGAECGRCHGETALPPKERFLRLQADLPRADFGNGIDWAKAMESGRITPKASLAGGVEPLEFDKDLVLTPENPTVPPVRFPHRTHTRVLDCDNCHPDIFDVKLKGTYRLSMKESLKGRFCGVCHLRVAFPFDDCVRCHVNVWPE